MNEILSILFLVALEVGYLVGVLWFCLDKIHDWTDNPFIVIGSAAFLIITPIAVISHLSSDAVQHKNEVCIRSHQEYKNAMWAGKVFIPGHYELKCDEWEPKK